MLATYASLERARRGTRDGRTPGASRRAENSSEEATLAGHPGSAKRVLRRRRPGPVDIVERALRVYGPPVYVRHEIVAATSMVGQQPARKRGSFRSKTWPTIPQGAITHLQRPRRVTEGRGATPGGRGLQVIDATCPLVSKVSQRSQTLREKGLRNRPSSGTRDIRRSKGTMGQVSSRVYLVSNLADVAMLAPAHPARLAYVTQTTLSVDDTREIIAALEARFSGNLRPPMSRTSATPPRIGRPRCGCWRTSATWCW